MKSSIHRKKWHDPSVALLVQPLGVTLHYDLQCHICYYARLLYVTRGCGVTVDKKTGFRRTARAGEPEHGFALDQNG